MSEKKNYWTQSIGTQDAIIQFGGISSEKDVRSDFKVVAKDGGHYFTMDSNVGESRRKGWTTLVSPGATQISAGYNMVKGQNCILINAMNGDITIKAKDGNLRFEGDKINFVANQSFNVESHDKVDINAKDVNIHARQRMRIKSSSFLAIRANCGIEIWSKIIQGISCATSGYKSKLGVS